MEVWGNVKVVPTPGPTFVQPWKISHFSKDQNQVWWLIIRHRALETQRTSNASSAMVSTCTHVIVIDQSRFCQTS